MEATEQLDKSLKRGVTSSVYLLCGEESYLRNEAVDKIKGYVLTEDSEAFNFEVIDGEKNSGANVVSACETLPVFAEKRLVIVNNPVYLKGGKGAEVDQDLLDYMENPNPSTCLVFNVDGKVDKRKKIVKLIYEKGQVLWFQSLRGYYLTKWINEQVKRRKKLIDTEGAEFLATAVGENLLLLEQEIEKATTFITEKQITKGDLEKIVSPTSHMNVFNLIDLVSEQKPVAASHLLETMLHQGEAPIKLIFLLARQYRLLLKTKLLKERGVMGKELASRLGVMGFVARKLEGQCGNYGPEELIQLMSHITEVEVAMKTGKGHHDLLLKNLILKLAEKK
ncbi:DNA polymerase-3 subunit delta [Desulfitispora alkaliphila]|uniref:DNA polymerase III subunit delta n=1 Tax=Desulfitispora alkaliphila TaxID=622674 RepID=UPI003D2222B5